MACQLTLQKGVTYLTTCRNDFSGHHAHRFCRAGAVCAISSNRVSNKHNQIITWKVCAFPLSAMVGTTTPEVIENYVSGASHDHQSICGCTKNDSGSCHSARHSPIAVLGRSLRFYRQFLLQRVIRCQNLRLNCLPIPIFCAFNSIAVKSFL